MTRHSFPQSPSFAVSVITFVEERSKDNTVAVKFPFSVATLIVESPLPGGPETGVGVGLIVGVGVVDCVGVGVGVSVGVGLGVDSSSTDASGIGVVGSLFSKFITPFFTAKYDPTDTSESIRIIAIPANPFFFTNTF